MDLNFHYIKEQLVLNMKAQNWHRVSSLGKHFKINIFGTHPEANTNVNEKKNPNICLSMTRTTKILIYFFSKSNCWRYLLLMKKHSFAVSYISRIHVTVAFS